MRQDNMTRRRGRAALIAAIAIFWPFFCIGQDFPAELPFGSQEKVTEYIRSEINCVSITFIWDKPHDDVVSTVIWVPDFKDAEYSRQRDGELEDFILSEIDLELSQFLRGESNHPEALKEEEEFYFLIQCTTYYVDGERSTAYSPDYQRGTAFETETPKFTVHQENGQWIASPEARQFTLPFNQTIVGFYLPGVHWVEFRKWSLVQDDGYESLSRNGVEDPPGGCEYGTFSALYGNGMIYIPVGWINGESFDIPNLGIWGKMTLWLDEERTRSVTYDLATGKRVVQHTTISKADNGNVEITLHGAEPGKEYRLVEYGDARHLALHSGKPSLKAIADEHWQARFVVNTQGKRAGFFQVPPPPPADAAP